MNIRPLYDRIVVKRIEEQESIRNGIFIPDSAKEKPQESEVMAVGPEKGLALSSAKMGRTSSSIFRHLRERIPFAR